MQSDCTETSFAETGDYSNQSAQSIEHELSQQHAAAQAPETDQRQRKKQTNRKRNRAWTFLVYTTTFLFSSCCLSVCGRMKTKERQMLWREKAALCLIIFFLMAVSGFITFGLSALLCKKAAVFEQVEQLYKRKEKNAFLIHGRVYLIEDLPEFLRTNTRKIRKVFDGSVKDVSLFFERSTKHCRKKYPCYNPATRELYNCLSFQDILISPGVKVSNKRKAEFTWELVGDRKKNLLVFNNYVLDMSAYLYSVDPLNEHTMPYGKNVDRHIRNSIGGNATLRFAVLDKNTQKCFVEQFLVGYLGKKTFGCMAADIIFLVSFVVIFGVLLMKAFMAILFSWTAGRRLGRLEKKEKNRGKEGGNGSLFGQNTMEGSGFGPVAVDEEVSDILSKKDQKDTTQNDILNICSLVTCYSEGASGLKRTFDSIAETEYPDEHKLLFIVADGDVKGSDNGQSTPEIILSLLDIDEQITGAAEPAPSHYIAVASGSRQVNMARVYAGWYCSGDHRVPVVFVSKCGSEWERGESKPGNRGKRDSQIILMSMFSKALFDDRMTPLEYELFQKIHLLTGIFADGYDLVLMVDADTVIDSRSLTKMACCMKADKNVVGLCGETKIDNKFESWVTQIQVFEYYISHHMNKAFESIFGCVTCLPGCFCMYRIKVQKDDGFFVPIIASPEIIDLYSKSEVATLHEKNLLHLGEDRYLTTLMLKTFPKRKLVFVPSAYCWTIVPSTFRVLLSQRRRWINSTIHNLFELVLIPEMCGVFCFSMKFVIFMELVGTLVLPAAITFTVVLIVLSVLHEPQYLQIIMLLSIFFFPPLVILFFRFQFAYTGWMIIYILSLPIWNGILPLYSYWRFDDFSWGKTSNIKEHKSTHTRKEKQGNRNTAVPMKTWSEWEEDGRWALFLPHKNQK